MSPYTSYSTAHFQAEKEHRLLTLLHWVSVPLILGVLGVGAYRSLGLSGISSRMDFVVISAAAKSLVFLAYIFATTYIPPFKRRYSPRAVLVLSAIDAVFWPAALGLTAYGIITIKPTGVREILSYTVIGLTAVMFVLSLPILYLAFRQDRHAREAKRDGEASPRVVEVVRNDYMLNK